MTIFTRRLQVCHRHGLTLLELVVVLAILIGLASLMVPVFSDTRDDSATRTTEATLVAVRDALARQWSDTKYVALAGAPTTDASELERFRVNWLFENPANDPADPNDNAIPTFDPDSRIGWNGPYLISHSGTYTLVATGNFTGDYGDPGDKAVLDSFNGLPIVIQVPNLAGGAPPYDVRIVSAGPNEQIDIPLSVGTDALTDVQIDDDLFVSLILR